jgi:acetyl-CoA carboxylase biotin carboxyl carrier protein
MDINITQIRELADLALEKSLAELTVTDKEQTVTIKTALASVQYPPQQVVYATASEATGNPSITASVVNDSAVEEAKFKSSGGGDAAPSSSKNVHLITAPMVGTFYSSPSPDSPPFVEVGTSLSVGQTICIIEAMKLMNELESEVSGKVLRILVENGQPVEFGQPLVEVSKS